MPVRRITISYDPDRDQDIIDFLDELPNVSLFLRSCVRIVEAQIKDGATSISRATGEAMWKPSAITIPQTPQPGTRQEKTRPHEREGLSIAQIAADAPDLLA